MTIFISLHLTWKARASSTFHLHLLHSHLLVQVSESRASTVYEIMIRSTIPSDSVEHKVTVGLIDITPSLQYTTVPKCTPQAFMIAKVVNKSPYTFLHGDTSVFLDNTFVCKVSLVP